MNTPIAIALLVGGVIMLVFGISASNSFASDVSQFFTGSLTNKAVWMVILVAGLVFTLRDRSKT